MNKKVGKKFYEPTPFCLTLLKREKGKDGGFKFLRAEANYNNFSPALVLSKFVTAGEYVLMVDARWNKSALAVSAFRELCIIMSTPT